MSAKRVKDYGAADSKAANGAQSHKLRCLRAKPHKVGGQRA